VNAAVRYLVYLIRLASKREVEASKSGARTTRDSGDLADWWLADWWLIRERNREAWNASLYIHVPYILRITGTGIKVRRGSRSGQPS
jgi:hypothetical protein